MYSGVLKLSETTSSLEYMLLKDNESTSISQVLNNKLMDKVGVIICTEDDLHIFEGGLVLVRENGIFKYFVGGECLDEVLLSNLGKFIELAITEIEGVREDEKC